MLRSFRRWIHPLTDRDYHKLADETMDRLLESFEDLGESLDVPGFDVTYSVSFQRL
jgi:frataxin-like iron-binding protein CyaY